MGFGSWTEENRVAVPSYPRNFAVLVLRTTTVVLIFAVALCIALLAKDLDSPNFWYDEAGQYWLSAGQFHFSAAGTANGTLWDVWAYSQGGNSDPGGFTLIVRAISKWIGTVPSVLRTAPFFFGLAALLLLCCWGRMLRLPTAFALATPIFLLNNLDFLYFMLELRAYSMEFCGVVALFLATIVFLCHTRALLLAVWILTFAAFSLSRYPFLVHAASACALLVFEAVRKRGRDCALLYVALGVALTIYLVIYFGMLQFQSILNGHPFVASYTLAGKSWPEIREILSHNFLSRAMLPKTVFLLLLPFEMVRRSRRSSNAVGGPSWNALLLLGGFIVIANCSSAFLSALGRLPWDVADHRWSFSEYALGALALPGVVAITWTWCGFWYDQVPRWWPQSIAAASGIVVLVLAVGTVRGLASYHRADGDAEQNYAALLAMSNYGGSGGSIVLDKGMWPSYRYLVERSGQPMPAGFKSMPFEMMDFSDLAAVATKGAARPRPVHFIFGTWDRQQRDRLQKELTLHGSVEATFIDARSFTNLVTLLPVGLPSARGN